MARTECPYCGRASIARAAMLAKAGEPEERKAFLSGSAFVLSCPYCSRKRRSDRPLAYRSDAGGFVVAWFPPESDGPDREFLRAAAAGMQAGSILRYSSDWERATETVRILERGWSDWAVRIFGIDEAEIAETGKDAFGWHFVTMLPDGAAAYANRRLGEFRSLPRAEELFRALGAEFARACPEGSWVEVTDESAAERLGVLPASFRWTVVEG